MAGNRSRTGRIKGAVAGLSSPMPQVSLGSPRPASVASQGLVAENRRVQAGLPQERSELMWGVRPSTLGAVRRGETRDDRSSSDEDEVIDEQDFERRLIMKMEEGVRERDLAQLEKTARELKGKPGLGPIRKTIKKHIKKLQEEARLEAERECEGLLFAPNGLPSPTSSSSSSSSNTAQGTSNGLNNAGPTAPSMPRIFLEKPTTVIDLMPGVVGWVIGKGGQRIKEMMAASQCRMWVDQDVPADEPRKLHLMGTKGQVDAALKLVNDLLRTAPILQAASQQKGLTADKDGKSKTKDGVVLQQCQIVMDCPPHLVGLLIGKKGWTIKKIQQETSAQVSINQNVKEGAPRKIFIAGTQPAVQHAKSMIQEVLSYPGPAAQALLKSPRALLPPDKLSQQTASAQTLAGLAAHQGRGALRASAVTLGNGSLTAEQLMGPLASLHLAQACFVDSSDEEDTHDGPDEHNDGSSLGGSISHDGTADLSLPLSPLSLGEHHYYHPPTSTSTSTSTSAGPPLLTSGSVASLPPGFRLGGGPAVMKGAESWSSGSSSGGYESEEDTVLSPPPLLSSHAEASTPRSTARFSSSSPSPPPLPSPRPLKPAAAPLRISLPPSSAPSSTLPSDYGLFNRAPFSPWSPHAPTPSPRPSPATPISTPVGGATLFGYGSAPGGIRSFLGRLGLSRHAAVLEAHGVDMDALRLLKDNHLRALGVPTEDCLSIMDALMTETAVGPTPYDAHGQVSNAPMYHPTPSYPPPGLPHNKGWCLASLREGV